MKEFFKRLFTKKEPPKSLDEKLVLFLQATWCQKQLDDLLLMNQGIMQQLKTQPFNPVFLEKRNKIHHDINQIQPIVLATGIGAAAIIEQQFNVQFYLLSGRNRPVPKVEVEKPGAGNPIIYPKKD